MSGLFAYLEVDMKRMIVNRQKIEITRPEFPGGSFRFAFLTDLHNACGLEESARIFRALEDASPDFILCGGDMIVAHPGKSAEPARSFMKELASRYPVYAAHGNHEYRAFLYPDVYGSLFEEYTAPLAQAGIRFLRNDSIRLFIGGVPIRIIGFEAPRRYYRRIHPDQMKKEELLKRFGAPKEQEYTILLAHNPLHYEAYFAYGADLTLCGHYHGGVMQLPGTRGLISPDFHLFPNNCHGMLKPKNRLPEREAAGTLPERQAANISEEKIKPRVFVGAGLGEHTIPIRIMNPREIVIFDIRCAS